MVTITHLVKKYVELRPLLQEAFAQGIVNYAALAEKIKPLIEKELGKPVKHSALVMALRRVSDSINQINTPNFEFTTEILMKSDVVDITIEANSNAHKAIEKIYRALSDEEKTIFTFIRGYDYYELIANKTLLKKIKELMAKFGIKEIIAINDKLSAITIKYKEKLRTTPGLVAAIARRLAWNGISIYQIYSTNNEITIILSQENSIKAYNVLKNLREENSERLL